MAFKIVLILAFLAQVGAAWLAFRLNLRYRIYSAWLMISAAAFVIAILRFSTLVGIWHEQLDIRENLALWTTTLTSLLGSLFFVAGMALIEPFFQEIARAQETLQRAHRRLQSQMRETEEELDLARGIQQNLLPKSAPDLPGYQVAGASQPAEWTSGDYFDYVRLKDQSMAFVVADVSGHGLGPAVLMSSARASIRALANNLDDLGELLTEANEAIADAASGLGFVTALAARLDPRDGQLQYAAAGHTGYVLRAGGERQTLRGDTPPLGVLPDATAETRSAPPLQPGDILILITDGILETPNSEDQMFGEERLFDTVAAHRHEDAAAIVESLFDAARAFGAQPQQDDNTAIIVKAVASSQKAAASSEG